MVSPIEPAHSPFKNVDALACPGGRHWVFGDKSPSRVPIAGLKEICRSDQTAAFVKRGADRQNARRARRKLRSEERRGGKEGVRTCRSRWSPDTSKKKKQVPQKYEKNTN